MKTLLRLLTVLLKPGIHIGPGIFFETIIFAGLASAYLRSMDFAFAALGVLAAGIFFLPVAIIIVSACSLAWASFGSAFLYNAFSLPLTHFTDMPQHLVHYTSLTAGGIAGLLTFALSFSLHATATDLRYYYNRVKYAYHQNDYYSQYKNTRNENYENYEQYTRREAEEEQADREHYDRYYNSDNNQQSSSASTKYTKQDKTPYYTVLGISPDATPKEIRSAYLAKLKLNHPDQFHNLDEDFQKLANERTREINEAYEKLCA